MRINQIQYYIARRKRELNIPRRSYLIQLRAARGWISYYRSVVSIKEIRQNENKTDFLRQSQKKIEKNN